MKIVSRIEKKLTMNGAYLLIPITKNINEQVDELRTDKEYSISITEQKKKRTLEANSYAWVLCQAIAEKVGASKEEVYQRVIKDMGNFTVLPIKTEAIKRFEEIWQAHGIGWLTEDLGECRRTQGYHNIAAYHGSSIYDTKEMSRLIEGLIDLANELHIDVISEQERDLLIKEWGAKK